MRALVLDHGFSRGALAAVRALAAAGWEPSAGSPGGGGLAASSRWCATVHDIASPQTDMRSFAASVVTAVRAGGHSVVFAAEDAELLALSACRAEIPARVPLVDHDTLTRAVDKLELMRAAESAGLAVPRTVAADDEAVAGWRGPGVVKARLHATMGADGVGLRIPTAVLPDAAAIAAQVDRIRALGRDALLQEPVAGELLAYVVVCAPGGVVVAEMQQVAERTWPAGVGVSARARTVAIDRGLAEPAQRLLARLGWFGLAQLQFLREPDGRPRLIDLNARFYGSMALAAAAGLNLPGLWAGLAIGRPPPARPFTAGPGARYQWLAGDLQRAFAERRGGLTADVAATARWAATSSHGVFRVDDPRAGMRDVAARAANLRRRLRAA